MPLTLFQLLLFFAAEVLILYRLSHTLIQSIGRKVATMTHSRQITMYVLALLFLPGTILHELSHWIVARVVMVPTGEMVLWPRMEPDGFRLGSVAIAKTDTLRRFLIGTAPFLVGVSILFGILWFVLNQQVSVWWHFLLAGYSVFEIGNTMFSSKRDLEGSTIAIILILAIFMALYFLGFTIPPHLTDQVKELLETAIIFMLVPLSIDLALVLITKVL